MSYMMRLIKRDGHQIIIVDETRRSVQDFQYLLLGCRPVEWGTKKQILPTDATAVAELVVANKPTTSIQ